MSLSHKISHDQLVTVENSIKNLKLLAHLMSSTIMMKSLQSDQTQTPKAIDSIKLAFDDVKLKEKYELKKALRPIVDRHDMI